MKNDVSNRNEASDAGRNENSEWPDSAVCHKNQGKSLPDLSERQRNDANFSEKKSTDENDALNSDDRNESLSPRGGKL